MGSGHMPFILGKNYAQININKHCVEKDQILRKNSLILKTGSVVEGKVCSSEAT